MNARDIRLLRITNRVQKRLDFETSVQMTEVKEGLLVDCYPVVGAPLKVEGFVISTRDIDTRGDKMLEQLMLEQCNRYIDKAITEFLEDQEVSKDVASEDTQGSGGEPEVEEVPAAKVPKRQKPTA